MEAKKMARLKQLNDQYARLVNERVRGGLKAGFQKPRSASAEETRVVRTLASLS